MVFCVFFGSSDDLWLSFSESVFQVSLWLIQAWERRGLVNLVDFRDFLKLLSCLPPDS